MSILGWLTGSDDAAKKTKRAAKKATAANERIVRNEMLPEAQKLYDEQKGIAANAVTQGNAALTANTGKAVNALGTALKGSLGATATDNARQKDLYDDWINYGQGAIPLMEGGYGESPEAATAFMDRYENSPLYQAQYLSSLELANRGLDRAAAARGGLNNGGTIREAMREGNLLGRKNIMDYYGLLGDRMGMGMNATNALSGAYGRNTALDASAYDAYGRGTSSAWNNLGTNIASNVNQGASNALAAGNLFSNTRNAGYGTLTGGNYNLANAKMAANQGAAQTNAGVLNGALGALGTAAGGFFGGTSKPWFIS